MNNDKRLTTGDVMQCCQVSRSTVLKWIKSGKLGAYVHPDGQYRITQAALMDFLQAYDIPISEGFLGETKARNRNVAGFKVKKHGGKQGSRRP